MKRIFSTAFIALLCFSLTGCTKIYHGTDELMEKARQEIPVSDADSIELNYAGMCGEDEKAIVWYISGNEYQEHSCLPVEVRIKDKGPDYTFVHINNSITDRCAGTAIVI